MNNNGLIHAPVGIDADISPVLGVGSDDLGYLCSNQHGKINIWSRFKPLILNDVSIHLLQDYENGGKLWQGDSATKQCGLHIPYHTSTIVTKTMSDKFFNGEMDWTLEAPAPNSVQPARALDFDGYNHYAINPVSSENIDKNVWIDQYSKRFQLDWDVTTQGSKYNLGLDDICFRGDPLNNWYLGLLMRNKGGTKIVAVTADNPVGVGGSMSIQFEADGDWAWGQWEVVPFLSKTKTNTVTGDQNSPYYISINCDPTEITVHAPGMLTYGMLSAYWIDPYNRRKVGYTGHIINSNSSERTLKIRFVIGYVNNGDSPMEMTNVTYKDIGVLTIPARNSDGTPYIYNLASSDIGGAFEPLDIGSEYLGDNYWTAVWVGAPDTDDWDTAPLSAYVQVEQPIEEYKL